MPAQTTCPIFEVDRALSSYVNSREQTLRIRRTLSKYHASTLRPAIAAVQNQHLNQQCPQNITTAANNPPGITGTRQEYLQALKSLHQIQTKHQQVQSSLAELRNNYVDENPTQPSSEHDNETTRSYVSLLRQRRRLAELQAIQEAVDKLYTSKPPNVPQDLKAYIQNNMGEQPDLPAERLEQLSQGSNNDVWVFKVKQEVLEAKTNMECSQAAKKKAQAEHSTSASLQSQVRALECARDEIVEWVQTELVKMEEESVFLEDASPVKRSVHEPAPMDLEAAEKEIQASYEKYTMARADLIKSQESVQAGSQTREMNNTASSVPNTGTPKEVPTLHTVKLLPHLPRLAQTVRSERALLQHSVYLQSQISSADQDIAETLQRLAGESHLLPGGSSDLETWGKTSREADAATEEFVERQLQASKQELSNISAIVELTSLQSKLLSSK